MNRIIFESHATSIDNEKKLASGWLDPPLSEKGIEQAKELGQRYKGENLRIIYVSDLKRSYQIAKLAFDHLAIPIVQDRRLREWNYGEWNGEAVEKIEGLKKNYIQLPFPGGESLEQVVCRFQLFNEEHLKQGNIMIIGHRAIYYALEHLYHNVSLLKLTSELWQWQPGWHYEMMGAEPA